MVSKEKLYLATNSGLSILEIHFPGVAQAAVAGKKFKMRPGEKTASASAKLYKTKSGNPVWKITDFGVDAEAKNPIQIHMEQCNLSFAEAIQDLAARFNVTDDLDRAVNRPDVRKKPATIDQEENATYWDIDQNFTERECAVMGPRVTAEHLKALHWYRANHIVSIRNREATYKYSNENYPIFMRECWFEKPDGTSDRFYKIYEPLNTEKQWRFQYQPKGKKPQDYINGLSELQAEWTRYNESEERLFNLDPANEGKVYEPKKIDAAVICSGERDALCVRSMGYFPLWFNSETYRVTDDDWWLINKYVNTVYNIPDIDATGRQKGTQLALRFIEISTVWLPEKLALCRDNRGRPCKDLRDWMEMHKSISEFRGLLEVAVPAKFWTVSNVKGGGKKYSIDVSCLLEFLRLNGFYRLRDVHSDTSRFIRLNGNVVTEVCPKNIRDFVIRWSVDTYRPRELRNQIITTPYLSGSVLEGLPELDPDFRNFTATRQSFHFPTFWVDVTASGIKRHDSRQETCDHYVLEENVIPHNIRILPDMFEITHPEGHIRSQDFDIDIKDSSSNYFRYLINSSRIFWRKELESSLEGLPKEKADAYRKAHKFDIAGPNLDAAEIQEQKQCLINKIFTIGYLLHRHKDRARAWAPYAMDNVIGDTDQCNGRSGKSFMFWALSNIVKRLKLSGRNPKLMENRFVFEQIDSSQAFVLVDDCDENLPIKQFYDNVTDDMTIDKKSISAFNLKFEDAPKFAFTTNYVPRDFDPSSSARMIYVVFSDYYHEQTVDNDYLETRRIATDFGMTLLAEGYPETEWEKDINFMLQCVRFYLSVASMPIRIEPKMDNIIYRKHLRNMSDNFRDWAESYFAIDENGKGEHLDCEIVREDAFKDYIRVSGVTKTTMQRFSKQLGSFCATCSYIDSMNPEDLWTSGSRILKRRRNKDTDKNELKEMLYIRTIGEAARLKTDKSAKPTGIAKEPSPSNPFNDDDIDWAQLPNQ